MLTSVELRRKWALIAEDWLNETNVKAALSDTSLEIDRQAAVSDSAGGRATNGVRDAPDAAVVDAD